MKVSLEWLRQYTDIPTDAPSFQDAMIMHGTGVEGVEDLSAQVQNVVAGKILSVRPHENSDHMVVCMIDVGEKEPIQVVTGAPNVHEGDTVPVAKVGAILPGGKKISKGKLRGVESFGMCCSGPELGVPEYLYPSVGDKGLLIFRDEIKPGTDVRAVLGIDQTIIDFEILANRPDCLSVWGLAGEAAATLGTEFRKPEIKVTAVPGRISDDVTIDVRDETLCPRYCGRVIHNLRVGPSPMWMRKALHSAGVRSINNIVDITNYVMLETGHPMHAFDLSKVKNRHIIVRRAFPGEKIVTLDGKERDLTPDMLMIADETNATGIAGVMGGEESEITEATTDVLLETAAFDRTSIRLTTRALGMRTEASGRFERGVNAATCREAADRACQLINLLDAGDVVDDVYDFYPHPHHPATIEASIDGINARTGVTISGKEMVRILERLQMTASIDGDCLRVVPPIAREDIENEADISEEVLRIYGYEHIPSTKLRGETSPGTRNGMMQITDKIGRILTGKGMHEIRCFSFISPAWIDQLQLPEGDPRRSLIRIRNPLGEDTSVMRSTLIPSMLQTLALNQNRNNEAALLYEIGPAFLERASEDGLPEEHMTACLGAYGPEADFYMMRDMISDLFAQFGIATTISRVRESYLHPGRSAELCADGKRIATIGEVHPAIMQSFDLSKRTIVAELDVALIKALAVPVGHMKPISGFPAVTRDIALVMAESVMVGQVADEIRKTGGSLLEKAEVFDIYRGAPILPGYKSVAYSLIFRSADRTLSEDDVTPLMDGILSACKEKYGAALRI